MTEPLTLFPAIMCLLILAFLGFFLFATYAADSKMLNAIGGAIQWVFSKVKGLFTKKPASAPVATILPINPPTLDGYMATLTHKETK